MSENEEKSQISDPKDSEKKNPKNKKPKANCHSNIVPSLVFT